MRLINADKLEIDICYARSLNKAESIYDYSYSEKQIQNAPTVKAIPTEWIEQFMNRFKLDMVISDEYALLHFMLTEWENENAES